MASSEKSKKSVKWRDVDVDSDSSSDTIKDYKCDIISECDSDTDIKIVVLYIFDDRVVGNYINSTYDEVYNDYIDITLSNTEMITIKKLTKDIDDYEDYDQYYKKSIKSHVMYIIYNTSNVISNNVISNDDYKIFGRSITEDYIWDDGKSTYCDNIKLSLSEEQVINKYLSVLHSETSNYYNCEDNEDNEHKD
jgi:hypothetical protein